MPRKSIYKTAGLTPFRSIVLHLLLIGYPFRYGLLLFRWGEYEFSFGNNIIPVPCSIFHNGYRRVCERDPSIVDDFGLRFFSQYSLACVTLLLLRKEASAPILLAFLRVLLIMSSSFLALIIWIQHYFFPTPLEHAFDENWFHSTIICYILAVLLMTWSVFTSSHRNVPPNTDNSMKWSIPANAIFCDAVFHMFLATASFQQSSAQDSSPDLCFCLTGIQIALQSLLLFRSRYFLTETIQLQHLCLCRAVITAWLPLPSVLGSSILVQGLFRVGGFLTYCLGFSWAGKAEGFSDILSGEKED